MVIKQLLQYGAKILSDNQIPTPQLDAAVLLCCVLGKDRTYLIINYEKQVSTCDEKMYLSLIEKRANGMPSAYITGVREFMSLDFYVNENVLIPRADTETLCEYVLEKNRKASPKIADICCGSGCIGISLAVYIEDAVVTMIDISNGALAVAKSNAEKHGVDGRCTFEQNDIMSEISHGKFDIVVSNPPYIESDVIATLDRNVAEYEPRIALDGGDDGLMFYRRLSKIAPDMLTDGGMLALEVGHTQAAAVLDMLRGGFVNIGTVNDLAGVKRVVFGTKNSLIF